MQFRLRTLLIVLAVLPPLLAGAWFEWMAYRARQQESILMNVTPGITIVEEEGTLGLEQGKGQGKGVRLHRLIQQAMDCVFMPLVQQGRTTSTRRTFDGSATTCGRWQKGGQKGVMNRKDNCALRFLTPLPI